jgi:hypothetical protein
MAVASLVVTNDELPPNEAVEKLKSTFTDYPISKESAAFF